MSDQYPYPDNPGQTHYPGCWRSRGHHNCAVHEIERLQQVVVDTLDDPQGVWRRPLDRPGEDPRGYDTYDERDQVLGESYRSSYWGEPEGDP